MNQLFYNIAGGTVHQIRRDKRTTISEVIGAFHPTVKRIATALLPSLLPRCFSLFLPHLRTLAQEKRSQNCLRFGTGGPSLCIHYIVTKYNIFPRANNGRSREKNSCEAICSRRISAHYRDFEHALRILNLIARLC